MESGSGSNPTIAWFNCGAGISGDMALGALVDAGADLDAVNRALASTGVANLEVRSAKVVRGGISATSIEVWCDETNEQRTLEDITAMLEKADLTQQCRERALAVFNALASAEASLHGVDINDVHFHEVGAADSIADVVGTCVALEYLGVSIVATSPVALGQGWIGSSHGALPNPAPATLRLLEGFPVYGTGRDVELTTPTGAALLAGLKAQTGPMPPMTPTRTGFGAGSRELEGMANCLTVVIGEADHISPDDMARQLELIETNIDDATGEVLAHTLSRLLDQGARDAWVTATTGKKGRPAHVLSVLVDPERACALTRLIAEETGTLGIRRWPVVRWERARRLDTVIVHGVEVRIKVSGSQAKAEYDDLAALAALSGTTLKEAEREARRAWEARWASRNETMRTEEPDP